MLFILTVTMFVCSVSSFTAAAAGREGRRISNLNVKQLEKLKAAEAAYFVYLRLPVVTFGYLSLHLVTFPRFTEPYWALLGLTRDY